MQDQWEAVRSWFNANRDRVAKLVFELIIIVIGVTTAFALEGMRQDAADQRYRESMIEAMIPTLNDVIRHNKDFDAQVETQLATFDTAIKRGEQPELPVFREEGSERPPSRIWDSAIAVGAAQALPPELLYRLGLFYTRQESFGERYIRYNDFTENRVFTVGDDQSSFYDSNGKLKPEYAAYVDRLRDLQKLNAQLTKDATQLRSELNAFLKK